jgi:hypothetical protein
VYFLAKQGQSSGTHVMRIQSSANTYIYANVNVYACIYVYNVCMYVTPVRAHTHTHKYTHIHTCINAKHTHIHKKANSPAHKKNQSLSLTGAEASVVKPMVITFLGMHLQLNVAPSSTKTSCRSLSCPLSSKRNDRNPMPHTARLKSSNSTSDIRSIFDPSRVDRKCAT